MIEKFLWVLILAAGFLVVWEIANESRDYE